MLNAQYAHPILRAGALYPGSGRDPSTGSRDGEAGAGRPRDADRGTIGHPQPFHDLAADFRGAGTVFQVRQFGGECSTPEIDAGVAQAKAYQAGVIVGGGRQMSGCRPRGGRRLESSSRQSARTLASSDAPCSALSVVYTPQGEFDRYLFYRRNPDLVLVDTTVIAAAPARYLVSGMGDALATWFEARTVIEARQPNQLGGGTSLTAGAIARLCYDTLIADGPDALAAAQCNAVTPALERIVEANTLLSGLGFESGGLAIAHSVHNGLTVASPTHHFLHGEKVAFGLIVQLVVEGRPSTEIEDALRFCGRVGLPVTWRKSGLPIPMIASSAR